MGHRIETMLSNRTRPSACSRSLETAWEAFNVGKYAEQKCISRPHSANGADPQSQIAADTIEAAAVEHRGGD
jgi:hypothetical protein